LDPRVLSRTIFIGIDLLSGEDTELLAFLDKNNDVFASSTSDLIGVSRDIIEHKLQVNLAVKPRKQKLRKMSEEKVTVVKAEVQRQLDVGFIREVTYPAWLVNVVMVKKKNEKWRMCTDFTDLNKCCPKDDFPHARIDKIVDSALLDYFSGYHQIWLRKEGEETTSFITPFGTYGYMRMPEGLRNAGPTFCRMTKAMLKDQVGRNIFTYVDDIVVTSKKKSAHIFDLTETFANMRGSRLKLNPKKCAFGVFRGKILGCLVSLKGIEANPDKIRAITQMKSLQSRKDVQKLMGRIAALNIFIAKLVEWSLPFFAVLRGFATFEWGPEQQKSFKDLKDYL
jgi:hypothetical protein